MDTSLIPRYTYADYELWKEDWELIHNYLYQLLPAKWQHNRMQLNVATKAIGNFDKNRNYDALVFTALDWEINNDTVVRSNVMIVCDIIEF